MWGLMSGKKKDLTLNQAADYLGVSYWTLRRYVKKGLIAYTLTPNKWRRKEYRFALKELERFTSGNEQDNKEEVAVDNDTMLKKYIRQIEEENAFLRDQVQKKDQLLEANLQIVGRLTHQTEVLLALTQGVDIQMLIKGEDFSGMAGKEDKGPEPEASTPGDMAGNSPFSAPGKNDAVGREVETKLADLVAKLVAKGLNNDNIAVFLNKRGIPSPAQGGNWDADLVADISKS